MITGLVVLVILLVLSSLFSGSEVALFTLDAGQKEDLANADDAASKRVTRLLHHPRTVLVTILIMNTIVNVGAAITAGPNDSRGSHGKQLASSCNRRCRGHSADVCDLGR